MNRWLLTAPSLAMVALIHTPSMAAEWTFVRPSNTGIHGPQVQHLAVDPWDRLWVAARFPSSFEGGYTSTSDLITWTNYSNFDTPLTSDMMNGITFAAQDDIWMATDAGAARLHDGDWTIFTPTNSPLPGKEIFDIAAAPDGAIWMVYSLTGLFFGGVARYDDGVWTIWDTADDIGFDFGSQLDEIALDTLGNTWVNTRGGGGLARFDGTAWSLFNEDTGYSNLRSDELAAGFGGEMWIEWYLGVMKFDGTAWVEVDSPVPSGESVSMLHAEPDGTYWAGTFSGTLFQPTGSNSWVPHAFDDRVTDLDRTSDGRVWVGGIRHIAELNLDTSQWMNELSSDNTGLPTHAIRAFARDADGRMWTATSGAGVESFDGTPSSLNDGAWRCFNPWNFGREPWPFNYDDSYGNDTARDVIRDDTGNMWIASSGVAKWDGASWTRYTPDNSGLTDTDIETLGYGDGTLWVGFDVTGINSFDGTTWTHHPGGVNGLPFGGADDIVVDSVGRVWAATGSSLSMYDGFTWVVDPFGPMPGRIFTLEAGNDGDLWVGTAEGLLYHDGSSTVTYTLDNSGVPANNIKDVLIASDGAVWVTGWRPGESVGGVASFRDGEWTTFLAHNSPLLHYQVTGLGEDASANIWVGTESEGVSIVLNPGVVDVASSSVDTPRSVTVRPHPFRSRTALSFDLGRAGRVDARIYDVSGRQIAIQSFGRREAGRQTLSVDGRDLAPGVYYYDIGVPGERYRGRLVRLR